ncbi:MULTISPECIES: AMP-binding protein [unclassified Novosphingobium]|uniref:AMP-binding protein n=1 Tax=unclassified Novosphingobium TaxID=2644732 RepID=UPI0013595ECA|nr:MULTISPECIES: AMP-binding protein [unclassified Novosphingobium]
MDHDAILGAEMALDPQTLGGTLAAAAHVHGTSEALIYDGRRATHAQLFEEALERARALIGLGVRSGDHVGVLMPNCWDYIVLYYAINLVGAQAVLLNARYRPDDLAYVIPKARLRFLFVGGHAWRHCDYRPMLTGVFPELLASAQGSLSLGAAPNLEHVIEIGDERPGIWPGESVLESAAAGVTRADVLERAAMVRAEDIGLMIFSSGTTSRPKACMLTHLSLCRTGAAMAERFRFTPQDKVWDPLPLFHMSTILPLAGCRATGACFMGMGHFDADSAMKLLIAEQPTVHYAGFPTIIGALVTHPDFVAYDQSHLRINHVVGPPDLLRRYAALFPGAVAVNSYGLTEATGVPCYSDLDDPQDLLFETNGRLFDGMEGRVVDLDGNPVPNGVAGEICLRGYALFAGYYDDPEATAAAITPEGWLRTGDRGRIGPGGRLIYDGRVKDMLKIGGENVAAVELESFLMTHPAVKMAQVIGVPDERLMEVAAAYIEVNPGSMVEEVELVRHCIGRIASYKIPRYVRFVEQWPMSATKVQKFELRESFRPDGKIDVAAMAKSA